MLEQTLNDILSEIQQCTKRTTSINVKDRIQSNVKSYADDLEFDYDAIIKSDIDKVIKEVCKWK